MAVSVLYFERLTNTRLQTGSAGNTLLYLLLVLLIKSNFTVCFALVKFTILRVTNFFLIGTHRFVNSNPLFDSIGCKLRVQML